MTRRVTVTVEDVRRANATIRASVELRETLKSPEKVREALAKSPYSSDVLRKAGEEAVRRFRMTEKEARA